MTQRLMKLHRRQLDRLFITKQFIKDIFIPNKGWIWEIRNALGMTYTQLANRLNVTPQAISFFEKSEIEGAIKIDTLKKVAAALNCKVVYAIVPNESLEKTYDDQVLKVAGTLLKRVSHTMNLEKQGLNKKENRQQLNDLIEEINSNKNKKIWDYEI